MAERRRVLVVEDDAIVRAAIADALAFEDYDVRAAADGASALQLLETWLPDVIVLDLMMPGMDGFAFREEQRKRPPIREIPVIVVSASRDLDTAQDRLAPAGVLAKPFDLDVLLDAIESGLSGPTPSTV